MPVIRFFFSFIHHPAVFIFILFYFIFYFYYSLFVRSFILTLFMSGRVCVCVCVWELVFKSMRTTNKRTIVDVLFADVVVVSSRI